MMIENGFDWINLRYILMLNIGREDNNNEETIVIYKIEIVW